MAKLSITFKGMPLQSIELRRGETSIGRDPSNDVHIDSLAIADFHAIIRYTPEGYYIQQLQTGFPILLNTKPVTEEILQDGDIIVLGKHSLYFSEQARSFPQLDELPDRTPTQEYRAFEGSFQVMNGKHIGMVIPLKANVTQMGKGGSGLVIVTKGEDGYTITPGSSQVLLTINGHPVTAGEARLADGDMVRINSALLQFFQK